jgi:hypothetical protein
METSWPARWLIPALDSALEPGRTNTGVAVAWVPSFVRSTGGAAAPSDSEQFRSAPRTGRSTCDRLSIGTRPAWAGACTAQQTGGDIANPAGPLLHGAVRRAQFHLRSPPLRRLATFAKQRHQRAGAEAGRSAVSPKAFNRVDRARAHGAALPGRNRAQRGSRPRGCTDVDAASLCPPISPSCSGKFGAPIELMPNGIFSCITTAACR